jgi:hypothetical protein
MKSSCFLTYQNASQAYVCESLDVMASFKIFKINLKILIKISLNIKKM